MKKFFYTFFASVLCCMILASCHDEEVTPAHTPNIIKVYLTKADFKARLIPMDNGSSRFAMLDDAMKRKVDSVLCRGGLGPNRLNILQDADEANIDRAFSASVEQVERELSALNLLGSLCVYSRELQQCRADSTLELCYQKVFGDPKYAIILKYDINSGSEDKKNADDFIEEFGQPDPLQDWSMITPATLHVDLSGNEAAIGGSIKVYTNDPYRGNGHILFSIEVTESLEVIAEFDIPKNLGCVYVLLQDCNEYINYKPIFIENGRIEASFASPLED